MDVGATLRRARTEKRLTLDQLSRATKISLSNLRAIETHDYDHLPAPVYTRGFLRTYAREVGLNPEDTVEQYMEQLDEALAVEAAARAQADSAAAEAEAAAAAAARAQHREQRQATARMVMSRAAAATSAVPLRIQIELKTLPRPALTAAAVVLLIAVVAAFALRGNDDEPQVAAAATQPDAAPAAGAGAPASDAAHVVNVADDMLRIELKTTGPCWVSASADRSPVLTRLLQKGDSETIEAKDEFVLRVGDPSTLELTINGAPVRSLGRARVPVTVQINRGNYKDFVGRS